MTFFSIDTMINNIVYFSTWGRGFDKTQEACARYEGSLPEYDIKKLGIMVLCKACDRYLRLLSGKDNNSLISNERIMSGKIYGKILG